MKKLVWSIVLVVFVSCAPAPPKMYTFDKSTVAKKNYDEVWGKTIKFLSDKNVSIKAIDKNTGIISGEYEYTFDYDKVDECDCGYISRLHGNFDTKSPVNITITKVDDNNTKIVINFKPKLSKDYFDVSPNSNAAPVKSNTNCNSTGNFEKQLIDELKK